MVGDQSNKIKRQETVAYKASLEIHQILHTDDSGIYQPWQFEDYEVITNTLRTTYEELHILWREEARFREGFKIQGKKLYLPNIFAKVNGVTTDIELYKRQLNSLMENKENTIVIERIPFTMAKSAPWYGEGSKELFEKDGSFSLDKIKELKEYRFHYLKSSVQKHILDKLNLLITTEGFFTYSLEEDFKYKILSTILSLDRRYLELIQRFDYPYTIPKLLIYNGDDSCFTREDMIILAFLHLVGFDIIIFTPTGYNNIEKGINPSLYDIHKLDRFAFNNEVSLLINQQQKKTSLLKKGFLWFFQ